MSREHQRRLHFHKNQLYNFSYHLFNKLFDDLFGQFDQLVAVPASIES